MSGVTASEAIPEEPGGAGAPPRAGAREWYGLALLALPLLVLSLDVSVLYLAAPQLSADLAPTATQQLWILDIYGFLIAGFLITMGSVGDRIGRRKLLLIGGGAFAVASVLAAFAPSAELLIVARALLGIAGATLMPSTLALIRNMFADPTQRSFAIAIWMTTFSAGVAIGPVVGGALLEAFWWGAVFLLGVPVMVLLVALGPVLLPEHRNADTSRIDPRSVAMSLATMLPLVYGIKETVARGPGLVPTVAAAAGLGFGVAFVRRQRRMSDPLLDVRLFTHRALLTAVAMLLLATMALNGLFFLVPQYLQLVREFSALQAGLWMMPIAVVSVLASLLVPSVAKRFGQRATLLGAALIATLSCVAVAVTGQATGLGTVIVLVSGAVVGMAPVGVLGTDLVVGSAPPERAGAASALGETAGELGVAVGVATAGTLVTAVYGASLSATIPPGVPAGTAAAATEGVAAANEAAGSLAPELGARLVDAAQAAFLDGFAATGVFSAVTMALIGTLAWLAIPRGQSC